MRKNVFTAAVVALGVGVMPVSAPGTAQAAAPPVPIPQQRRAQAVPQYIGRPAFPRPVAAGAVPQNPSMSVNPWSNVHNDTYMSDVYATPGPLGFRPVVSSAWLGSRREPVALVVGMTFDRAGRIVAGAVHLNLVTHMAHVTLTLIQPHTLATLATYDLPGEKVSGSSFRPAGVYFYQDQQDRTITGTASRQVLVISHTASSFKLEKTIDLGAAIPADDEIEALQPDFSGRLWFTSKGGVVGTADLNSGTVLGAYHLPEGERIVNSHATDETGGAFIASTHAMYRFDADTSGSPVVTWREPYDPGTRVKPGQVDIGTGTTPTLVGGKYVTITDNADPRMHVLVYLRAKHVAGPRLVCSVPVFQPRAGDTENSLVAIGRSIIVENNYGYKDETATVRGRTTTPGIARVDLSARGGCRTVWANYSVSIPSVVTKMSVRNGLIYTYTKPKGPGTTDPWYITALDFRTGRVVYSRLAGTGLLYNNHYAPMYLGPDGTVYAGVLGGLVAMRDAPRRPAGRPPRPRRR